MNKEKLRLAKVAVMALIPLVLLALPATFFDHGESLCLSKILADLECYGCGMTRAIMHLIHLDFEQAWFYNKLSFVVLPLLAFLYGQEFYKEIKLVRLQLKKAATSSPV